MGIPWHSVVKTELPPQGMQVPSLVRDIPCGGAAWLKKKFSNKSISFKLCSKDTSLGNDDNTPSATAVDSLPASTSPRKTVQEYLVNWEIREYKDVVSFQIKKNECSA